MHATLSRTVTIRMSNAALRELDAALARARVGRSYYDQKSLTRAAFIQAAVARSLAESQAASDEIPFRAALSKKSSQHPLTPKRSHR